MSPDLNPIECLGKVLKVAVWSRYLLAGANQKQSQIFLKKFNKP